MEIEIVIHCSKPFQHFPPLQQQLSLLSSSSASPPLPALVQYWVLLDSTRDPCNDRKGAIATIATVATRRLQYQYKGRKYTAYKGRSGSIQFLQTYWHREPIPTSQNACTFCTTRASPFPPPAFYSLHNSSTIISNTTDDNEGWEIGHCSFGFC